MEVKNSICGQHYWVLVKIRTPRVELFVVFFLATMAVIDDIKFQWSIQTKNQRGS